MKPITLCKFIIYAITLFLLSACQGDKPGKAADIPDTPDSLYTAAHIESIAFGEPRKALALLDTAEERRLLTPFEISDLRSTVYHNGFSHCSPLLKSATCAARSITTAFRTTRRPIPMRSRRTGTRKPASIPKSSSR